MSLLAVAVLANGDAFVVVAAVDNIVYVVAYDAAVDVVDVVVTAVDVIACVSVYTVVVATSGVAAYASSSSLLLSTSSPSRRGELTTVSVVAVVDAAVVDFVGVVVPTDELFIATVVVRGTTL